MRDGWRKVTLGEICDLTKGNSPTLKTPPGPYPLVVTGAEPLSADTYQFDGEAVCIPLVSSTGHGHASLKRVHYAAGRFAVANIVAACIRKEGADVDMRWLWLYLHHWRNELIVTRMKGTANVSLSLGALSGVAVVLPSLHEQLRIADLIGSLDGVLATAETHLQTARRRAAVFASDLWRSPEWQAVVPLGRIGTLMTGATPSTKEPTFWNESDLPFITPADLGWAGRRTVPTAVARRASRMAYDVSKRKLAGHAVLQVCVGATTGKTAVAEGPALFNQQINAVTGLAAVDARVLAAILSSEEFQRMLRTAAGSSTMPLVPKSAWAALRVPWPSEGQRIGLAAKLEALDTAVGAGERHLDALAALRSNLLTALLSGMHQIPDNYDELLAGSAA